MTKPIDDPQSETGRAFIAFMHSRWGPHVVNALVAGPLRWSALHVALGAPAPKVVYDALSRLIDDGHVQRHDPELQVAVYELTPRGRQLAKLARDFSTWIDSQDPAPFDHPHP